MRMIIEKTFAAEKIEVVTVPSGEAAIAKIKEIKPDVIIADTGMPGVSGYDLCKTVRDDLGLSNTPVIAMSGVSSPYDEVRGRTTGVTAHVKKPFDTTKLIEKVHELTQNVEVEAEVVPKISPLPPKPEAPKSIPSAFTRPEIPVLEIPKQQPSVKQTMEFAQPAPPRPSEIEVKPIEISEQPFEESIQVGTLAELAQMDGLGGTVQHEPRNDAIELDEPIMPLPETQVPPLNESAPIEETIKQEALEAATEVTSKVDGLTPEQADAITALTAEVLEKIVWEIVPDLAETIIKEHIEKLLQE